MEPRGDPGRAPGESYAGVGRDGFTWNRADGSARPREGRTPGGSACFTWNRDAGECGTTPGTPGPRSALMAGARRFGGSPPIWFHVEPRWRVLAAPSGAVLRTSRAHLARAIDQAGATVGLVALEDGPGRSGCFTWNWDVGEWWNLVGRRDRMTHSEARSASWLALVDSEPTAHLVSRGTALEVMASPPGAVCRVGPDVSRGTGIPMCDQATPLFGRQDRRSRGDVTAVRRARGSGRPPPIRFHVDRAGGPGRALRSRTPGGPRMFHVERARCST
jgi:hypothetical protein